MSLTRSRHWLLAVAVAVLALLCACVVDRPADAQPAAPQTIFGDAVPARPTDPESKKVEIGTRFTVAKDGIVTAIRFYKGNGNTGTHVGKLYAGDREVARVTFTNETGTGWQTAQLNAPIAVKPGTTYTASYVALNGKYASDERYAWPKKSGDLTATGGFYRYPEGYPTQQWNRSNYYVDVLYTVGAPAPTPTPAPTTTQAPPATTTPPPVTSDLPPTTTTPSTTDQPATCPGAPHKQDGPDGMGGCWPGPLTTGVPDSVTLTPYTGPVEVNGPLTIDAKQINSDIVVKSGAVTIKNSRMNGHVVVECAGCSAVIEDSEIDAGSQWRGTVVGYDNVTIRGSELRGAWASVICTNCTIEDSYLWGQHAPQGVPTHNDAFYLGGGGGVTFRHSTLWCSPKVNDVDGGCSADVFIGGDFGQLDGVTFDRNLFVASESSAYCGSFGWEPGKPHPIPRNIVVTGNVFQRGPNGKCALFGPVTSWWPNDGAVWENNRWDDGAVLTP